MKRKLFVALLLFIEVIIIFSNLSYAVEGPTNPLTDPGKYQPSDMENADKIKIMGNKVIGIVQFIGTITSIVVLIVIGIKYMTGSVEEKAEYKKTLMPYLIGAITVFAITNILGIISRITAGTFVSSTNNFIQMKSFRIG